MPELCQIIAYTTHFAYLPGLHIITGGTVGYSLILPEVKLTFQLTVQTKHKVFFIRLLYDFNTHCFKDVISGISAK